MVELSQALGEGEQGATTEVYLTREQLKQLAPVLNIALREEVKKDVQNQPIINAKLKPTKGTENEEKG